MAVPCAAGGRIGNGRLLLRSNLEWCNIVKHSTNGGTLKLAEIANVVGRIDSVAPKEPVKGLVSKLLLTVRMAAAGFRWEFHELF